MERIVNVWSYLLKEDSRLGVVGIMVLKGVVVVGVLKGLVVSKGVVGGG